MSAEVIKSDEELLIEIRNGVASSMEELIGRYRPTVDSIALKYINSPLEKEDLVQEGLIGLLAAINSYSSEKGAKFSTYASRCINNSVQTALRKFSRLKDIPPTSIMPLEEDFFDNYPALSAEDEYLAKESVSALTDFLYEGLSRFENEVLRLYIQGHSYVEIAEKLSKNPKAIDNAIQRIRKKLEGVTF
ncbi:MAG: sigma-70 family RNA polymerase sigma factor [Ruminococcaceae bacterium]|nr:sigma-70 family RNA polymerase sigma factor [Oscillospiraceae bacterium]